MFPTVEHTLGGCRGNSDHVWLIYVIIAIKELSASNIFSQMIPAENRAALIDDAFTLARRGTISYDTALDLTKYLKDELDYIPWEAALTSFTYIRNMFSRYSGYGNLEVPLSRLFCYSYKITKPIHFINTNFNKFSYQHSSDMCLIWLTFDWN